MLNYSPDSLQIITYLFDYIESKEGMLFPVSKMVEEGDFVLISVSYAPAFLYHLQARQASLSKN